jgi:hypothetical protein
MAVRMLVVELHNLHMFERGRDVYGAPAHGYQIFTYVQ